MRLYLTSYLDDQKNDTVQQGVFHGTQADASKGRVALKKDGMRNIETKEVDVPNNKGSLIAYLNGLIGYSDAQT